MVNKNKLRQKIAFIEGNLRNLRDIAQVTEDEFMASNLHFHASVRMLQIAVEAMIDAASHIVAAERLGLSKNYAHTFQLLAAAHIIPQDFAEKAKQMARFRNRAVHLYDDDIDPPEIYNILQNDLADFEEFVRLIVGRYLSE